MSIELRVPALGESITQATVGTWLKKEGDAVQVDEPVVEVESEKATVALPAPAAGVLRRIVKASGANVAVGEVIGELEEGAAAIAAPPRPGAPQPAVRAVPAPATPASASTAAPAANSTATSTATAAAAAATSGRGGDGAHGRVRAPPSVRRLMAERGLAAADVAGGAVVRRADLDRALEARPAPAPGAGRDGASAARERVVPMTPLRRTVARRLLEAQQGAAILTTFNEVDMSRVLALREKHGAAFLEAHGVKLGFMSFFVKASVEALRAWPGVNGEVRGQDIVYKDHYDIGVAVGGGKGLVVPVLRDADQLSFAQIEQAIGELGKKARENRITMQDLEGGTFTISNGGVYGSLLSTPILNPPQSGILGLHKIEKRAVVGPGDAVVVRPMMYVALSYDHRLVDGREAVSFLVRVKECIEDPERLLFEL
ncbi:2-oxoglutarate dehydrogenase complex dihydrolipoyllysine-residue succinyltransferase [Anaeromyxobacter diazotrophicus]|uniref:Dihydrolipoyllysine-residue succinyltransferase n=1 Tax=Anaeromyxobacter diazotrophicus TaxID=2590199 RepID=A0A7I9VRK0_9BACT|nr:2-oxoglutarate dehydrogenase complex dihydrolipoyllysine-residue succinyltransferase [Anaeromyxobacter diazotrophicus]GEJ59062.1 dihydrolipoyllysine-residue succinyltransferase component of 2-oxoglutarate dehydrogenase complex [Anaeromyxobacter diazotrophicus]